MARFDEAYALPCNTPSVTIVSAPVESETLDTRLEIDPSLASYLKFFDTGSGLLQPTSFLMPPSSETGYSSSGPSDMSSEISFDFSDNSVASTSLHQNKETRGRPPTTPRNRVIYSRSLSPGGLQTISTGLHRSTSADVSRFSPFNVVDAGPHPDDDDSSSVQMMEPDLIFIQASESASHAPSIDETRSAGPWLSTHNLSGRGRRRHRSHTSWSRSPSPYNRPQTSIMDPMDDLASPHIYQSDHIHNWQRGISMAESSRVIRWNQLPPHTTPEHIRLRESIIGSESWALDTLVEHMDMNVPNVLARAGENMNTFPNHLLLPAVSSQRFGSMGIPTSVEASRNMVGAVDNPRPSFNYLPPPTVPGRLPRPAETPTGVEASGGTTGTVDNTRLLSNHFLLPTPLNQQFGPFGTHTGIETRRSMAEALDNILPSPSYLSPTNASSQHFRPFANTPTGVEARRSTVEALDNMCPSPNYLLVETPTGIEASRGTVGATGLFNYPPPPTALSHRFQPSGTPTGVEASRGMVGAPENTLLSSDYIPSSTVSTQHVKPVGTPALIEASRLRRNNTVGGTVFGCTFEGCGGTFTTRHNLKNHENSHMGNRPFVCPKCNKDFTTKSTMTRHRDNVHKQD